MSNKQNITNNMAAPSKRVEKVHEPLFHIVKKSYNYWWQSWIYRIVAFIGALALCGILTYILTATDGKAANPFNVYVAMFEGNFKNIDTVWPILKETAILLCIAIAITPAFKMRFWNIGAEGQVLVGAFASFAFMYLYGKAIKNWLLLVIMCVCAIVAGALWALLPAIFKAKWGTNETLFTLMMNYIAIHLVNHFVNLWSGNSTTIRMGIDWLISRKGKFPKIFGQEYFIPVAIVLAITAIAFIYLKFSKQGYEIAVVGESENTARYVGINVKKVIIRTMLISGAICGIAGFLLVTIDGNITSSTAGGNGFTAIMVSWLAKFNPIYMIFTAFLITFFQQSGDEITKACSLSQDYNEIITAIIILFIIGSEFFINYSLKFRKKEATK